MDSASQRPEGGQGWSATGHPVNVSTRWLRFGLAVILTITLVAWVGRTAWRELHLLRANFATVESETFHLSDFVEEPIEMMSAALLDHELRHDEASVSRFNDQGIRLKQWLHEHTGAITNVVQRQLLAQLRVALDVYIARGMQLMQQHTTPDNKPVLEYVEELARPLLAMCQELAAEERGALQQFMRNSHSSLAWLQGMLVLSFLVLLGLGVFVVLSAYRELVAPLRTQLRQSRVVLERHEKLASLGTLAAGVAHEIRNPLTAINVRIHSLKRDLVPGSSEHEDATVIGSEIKRLEGIVQAFLQFARPAEPKFVTVSADSLLTRVRALMAGTLQKASIQLIVEPPPDLWVRVDPQQVEQVLINLVQNAAESIQHDGQIRLRAHGDSTRLQDRTSAVALEVSDTGKGIPPEVQKRLFDPFFTTKEEGTGLGLCIAARIVEQQGGALQYFTQPNRGTTFSISLPEAKHPPDELPR